MHKISIIIPVYNCEKYIKKCLDSLINQTYKNMEIILVNDGSTDKSEDILKKYKEKYPSLFVLIFQENKGASNARNCAMEIATGDYIMFVDADDWIDINCLETVISYSKKTNADIIKFKLIYEFPNNPTEEPDYFENQFFIEKKDFQKYIYKKLLTGIKMNSVCRTLFKRSLLCNIKFSEDMLTAEDLMFSIESFTAANTFLYITNPFYHYRQAKESRTGSGLGVIAKYKCNIKVTNILLTKYLKLWNMNSISNKLAAIFRLVIITFSKLGRLLKRE